MTESATYLVAGCKPWNRDDFNSLAATCPGRWLFAADEAELQANVDRDPPRYIFFLHWNWRVPEELWRHFECVCFHMTDVPYGRGGSPLQNLIVRGHRETKVSALRMVEEMDAGPVYAKRPLSLDGRAEDIYRKAGAVCLDLIRWMVETKPTPAPQEGEATVFKRRVPSQSELPPEADLQQVYDHIRMLDAPTYPPAFIDHGSLRLEFAQAHLEDGAVTATVTIRPRTTK